MSLKALVRQQLAAKKAGEPTPETSVKRAKQEEATCFTEATSVSPPMKHAKARETAKNGPCFTVSPPKGGNDETRSLPAPIQAGLEVLRSKRAPRLARPELWPGIVSDALRLAREGWAGKALALGWDPLQLWGCSPLKGGDVDREGLAVCLAGRQVALLDELTAIMESQAGTHSVFRRRPTDGALLLWDLG
jgi:hypothetical protein